ncbi:MAG TPA: hypothetical protein DEG69_12610 [Flavobacteriaceae bacterium]|nr:hypothetical protein [Flavobacteriaceae bacterium]
MNYSNQPLSWGFFIIFQNMKLTKLQLVLISIGVLITIIGLITGWYLFIFLWLPLGILFRKK